MVSHPEIINMINDFKVFKSSTRIVDSYIGKRSIMKIIGIKFVRQKRRADTT